MYNRWFTAKSWTNWANSWTSYEAWRKGAYREYFNSPEEASSITIQEAQAAKEVLKSLPNKSPEELGELVIPPLVEAAAARQAFNFTQLRRIDIQLPDVEINSSNASRLIRGPGAAPKGYTPGEVKHTKSGFPVTIKSNGAPDFSPYAVKDVKIDMKGGDVDYGPANAQAFPELFKKHNIDVNSNKAKWVHKWADGGKYADYEWHHVEDLTTMQLVPNYINNPKFGGLPHTGGTAGSKNK